jgi:thiamine biosynthesis lipoprotein
MPVEAARPLRGAGAYAAFDFDAMSTPCEVLFRPSSHAAGEEFRREALKWIAEFEGKFSKFKPDSVVSRLNGSAGRGWVELDDDASELFALCDWFYWLTNGVFDPSGQPLLKLWDYHRKDDGLPSDAEIGEARRLVGWSRIEREPGRARLPEAGMAIDLGGIGKEYAVDRVVSMGRDRGFGDILVNLGHDLRVEGHPPQGGAWRIGLENPTFPGRCWWGLALNQGAVCTSGNYLRFREVGGMRYGHIVDLRSGLPVNNGCRSVSVVAQACTTAGILAKAAFVLGGSEGLGMIGRTFGADGCLWMDGQVMFTPGFRRYMVEERPR